MLITSADFSTAGMTTDTTTEPVYRWGPNNYRVYST